MRALVAPAGGLTDDERERYSRHTVMAGIGELGQRRLKGARVLCVGAGGLGSPALLYLAAAGVGTIGIVDDDLVSESNLQRQVLYTCHDVGQLKVVAAAARLQALNPHMTVVPHAQRLSAANCDELIAGYDLVIDGADNFETRYIVNDACVRLGIPDVMGSVLQFGGQASVYWARVGPCYRCVFPEPPQDAPSCADAGVFGALCGTVGGWLATEAIKIITGYGESLVGRLATFDAAHHVVRHLALAADPQCRVCSHIQRVDENADVIPTMSALDVSRALQAGSPPQFRLIDIREAHELLAYSVAGAEHIPQAEFLARAERREFESSVPLVLFCHAGVRSANAVATLRELGYHQVSHIPGGILEWIADVDRAEH